jgi:hypothetical protein
MAMPIPTQAVVRARYGTRPFAVTPSAQVLRTSRNSVRPQGPDQTCLGMNAVCGSVNPNIPCLTWSQFTGYYCSTCCLPGGG